MTHTDLVSLEIMRSADFIKQVIAYALLCIGRFFFPHPEIETAFSAEFYGAVAVYFILTLALVFSYELLHDAFSTRRDEFSMATPKEKWVMRLLISAYFAFLLATPNKEKKLILLIAWSFSIGLAYLISKVRLRKF
ncbi:hypothetical protein [Thermococcus thermotolerans]|uniref:hypothetical protein n=1 Tax=Thermococcus thermotolerans TaxID=2969672 RepID=UPI002158195F|nr:hypothetical protein [Thermococcus thermotolerans]